MTTPNPDARHRDPSATVTYIRQPRPTGEKCEHGASFYPGIISGRFSARYCPHKCWYDTPEVKAKRRDDIAKIAARLQETK